MIPAAITAYHFGELTSNEVLREAVFVVVPVAAVALSTAFDFLFLFRKDMANTAFALTSCSIIVSILSMVGGGIVFTLIPRNHDHVASPWLYGVCALIAVTALCSLLTELFVSREHYSCHETVHKANR